MLGVNPGTRYFQLLGQDSNPSTSSGNSYSTPVQNRETNEDRSHKPFCHVSRSSFTLPPFQQSTNQGKMMIMNPENLSGSSKEEEADWFDIDDDIEILYQSTEQRFENFPVPSQPVIPFERLTVAIMDDYEFYCDDEDFVQVYTDGSFRLDDNQSAIGIWFGPNHKLNVSQPTYLGGYNSDGAELEAIIEAIKILCSCGVEKVQVNTDSKNSVRFVTYFISKWEANGWRNIRGQPVRNQNLIRQLGHYTQLVSIKWNYVPSGGGVLGNVEADRLARTCSASCAGKQVKNRKHKSRPQRESDFPIRNSRKTARYSPY